MTVALRKARTIYFKPWKITISPHVVDLQHAFSSMANAPRKCSPHFWQHTLTPISSIIIDQ
jgi:hypothetical protein